MASYCGEHYADWRQTRRWSGYSCLCMLCWGKDTKVFPIPQAYFRSTISGDSTGAAALFVLGYFLLLRGREYLPRAAPNNDSFLSEAAVQTGS